MASNKRFVLLGVLVAIDFAFMVLHIIHKLTPYLKDIRFWLGQDGGYAEFFQYGKIALIIVLLLYLNLLDFAPVYVVWLVIFSYFLIDDALQVHETVGYYLADRFHFPAQFGLRPVDFGELLASGTVGAVCLVLIVAAHVYSEPPLRKVNWQFIGVFAALAFFGVFVDTLHSVSMAGPRLVQGMVGLVEDGGEMLVMSFTVFMMLGMCAQRRALVASAH
jgi:hypothetical protein